MADKILIVDDDPAICCLLYTSFFSFWNQLSDYGDINTLTSNPDLTLIAYLAVGAVMLIWMLSTFFFTLSGIRHGTGRGLTYFVLVYVLSYLCLLYTSIRQSIMIIQRRVCSLL